MTAAVINLRFHSELFGGWSEQFGVGLCGNNSSSLMNGISVGKCRKAWGVGSRQKP